MKLVRTVLGIDLSGSRIAVVAIRKPLMGTPVILSPLVHDLRADKDAARFDEAEYVLGEFVARHELVGAEAFIAVPADRVHIGRAVFPALGEKDLLEAVGLELDRLFPISPETVRDGYRLVPASIGEGNVSLAIAAVPREYLDTVGQLLSRTGLSLTAAVPMGWAAGVALSRIRRKRPERRPGVPSVLLRWLGDSIECTVFAGEESLFCSTRYCMAEDAPKEGIFLALSGLTDIHRESDEPVDVYAPPGLFHESEFRSGPEDVPFRVQEEFPGDASRIFQGMGLPEGDAAPFPLLCAYGAATAEGNVDILSASRSGSMSRMARTAIGASAAAAILLGIAWPATVAWRAKEDLRQLDGRIAALRPFAEKHEKTLAGITEAKTKLAILQSEISDSGEPVRILKELTARIPNGTWLSSLRVEERSVDMEGFSPSASELFPSLTRDGRFRSVDFAAPITRQADNLERFRLKGEYVPPSATPPATPSTAAAPTTASASPAALDASKKGPVQGK